MVKLYIPSTFKVRNSRTEVVFLARRRLTCCDLCSLAQEREAEEEDAVDRVCQTLEQLSSSFRLFLYLKKVMHPSRSSIL